MNSPRREIKTRDTKWAKSLAAFVAEKTPIKPNEISTLSMLFAAITFAAYCGYNFLPSSYFVFLPLVAIFGIQMRLICNLIDGMVAVEGGKSSPLGNIYNEFPDRISDSLILIGLGLAGGGLLSFVLGLGAALMAMLTAYTRVLGGAIGADQYFTGPMAKQHRMALVTIASLICIFGTNEHIYFVVYPITLTVIIAGCVITVYRRLVAIAKELESKE